MKASWIETNKTVTNGDEKMEKIIHRIEKSVNVHEMLMVMNAEEMSSESGGEFSIHCKGFRRWRLNSKSTRYEFKLVFLINEGQSRDNVRDEGDVKTFDNNASTSDSTPLQKDQDKSNLCSSSNEEEEEDSEHATEVEVREEYDYPSYKEQQQQQQSESNSTPDSGTINGKVFLMFNTPSNEGNEKKKKRAKKSKSKLIEVNGIDSLKRKDMFKDL